MQNKNIISWSSLVVLAVLFLALVMLNNALFSGARLDLTENNLYTLSDGTRNILQNVEEPIHLRLFFSEETSRGFPVFRAYYQRVREMLEEFEQRSDGRVQVSLIDPKPFSEEEDQAAVYGIRAAPVGNAGDSFYFGLAGTNAVDSVEIIPFFDPRRERFLEYELAKLVYTLDHPELPRLGILSSFRLGGGFNSQTQQPTQPYTIYEQLQQFYEVVDIETTATELPEDLDALMVVHPKNLPQSLRYDIDQYALNGGNVMVFVDPYAQNDSAQPELPGMPAKGGSSNMPDLFEAWGVKFRDKFFVGDLRYALEINGPQGAVRHAGILGLNDDAMSGDDVITATLDTVNVSTAGFFEVLDDTSITVEPLLFSSENAQPISSLLLSNTPDVTELLQNFEPSGEIYNMAIRISGTVSSAFPDGAPNADEAGEHVNEGQINAILVGDTEMLIDGFWVQRQSFFGQSVTTPFAGNGDLVLNMADNLLGDANLISVRPRDVATRPFTLVRDLRVEAEKQFRATERQLENELRETEEKLNAMQLGRGDGGDGSDLTVLSPEQEKELQRFLDRKLEIRKDLRQVRRNLDRDIENLGVLLKAINILLIPILVAIAAVFYFLRRRQRQQQAGAAS